MKIKLYILHSDTPQSGIHVQVFPSKKARDKELIRIMQGERVSDDNAHALIEAHITAKEIDQAWELWRNYGPDDSYYTRFDESVEVPTPDVMVILEGGCVQNIITTAPIGKVRLLDYDVQEEADGASIFNIPQDGGKDEVAEVHVMAAERAGKWYRKVMASIQTQRNKHDKQPHSPMRAFEFYALCGEHAVDPDVALENEAIRAALKRGDTAEQIEVLLKSEF